MIINSRIKSYCMLGIFTLLTTAWAQVPEKPTIVTSIHPYYALVQEVAGENAEVMRLLPPGASPHTFDPTPKAWRSFQTLASSFLNGGLDEWLLDLVEASGTDAEVFEVISELSFEPVEGEEHTESEAEEEHAEESGEAHGARKKRTRTNTAVSTRTSGSSPR